MGEELHTLVVDDEKHVRFFLAETLRRAGHTVVTASDGGQALAELKAAAFDLVLLDLRLGARIDGQRVLESIKLGWPEVMVIILTGHGSLESAMAAISEGVDGYLLKPVEPSELLQAVSAAVERRNRQLQIQEQAAATIIRHGPIVVDAARHLVTINGGLGGTQPKEI